MRPPLQCTLLGLQAPLQFGAAWAASKASSTAGAAEGKVVHSSLELLQVLPPDTAQQHSDPASTPTSGSRALVAVQFKQLWKGVLQEAMHLCVNKAAGKNAVDWRAWLGRISGEGWWLCFQAAFSCASLQRKSFRVPCHSLWGP